MTAAPDSGRRAAGSDEDAAGRFAAVDVGYGPAGGARAAIVIAASGRFAAVLTERTTDLPAVAPYVPGQFFLRELPPLRAVLRGAGQLRLIVIDGYVDLDPDGRPGLGAYVHHEFAVPVVGVAKTFFRTATHAIRVHRGGSARPLYVTAAGLPANYAAGLVSKMSGTHRLPDALRRADALARGAQPRQQAQAQRATGGSGAAGT
jgi:deoxyribonuclease V